MTNNFGLPEQVVKALSKNSYNSGSSDYSATTLLRPPQQVILEQRYGADETDVVDKLWSVFGTAVHDIMEGAEKRSDAVIEERLYKEVLGKRVGGQVDHYIQGTISDYKCTSVYKAKSDDHTEWEQQLNIYAHLFRQNGYTVNNLQIIAILRDWSKNGGLRDRNYPEAPIVTIEVPLWDDEKASQFIEARVQSLIDAEKLNDYDLPPCQAEDMWYSGTKYAVMKEGNKRATKLYEDEGDAIEDAEDRGGKFYVEKREGEYRRCDQYCPVASVCPQKTERDGRI